ncbi:hypothetical protein R1flu_012939 [Riccia fluitans]|uniref:Uncharacterized protein n=1 Tax=Riccia fluitans TaxID=41844 RepID=A0ABD1ZFG4_9MARC
MENLSQISNSQPVQFGRIEAVNFNDNQFVHMSSAGEPIEPTLQMQDSDWGKALQPSSQPGVQLLVTEGPSLPTPQGGYAIQPLPCPDGGAREAPLMLGNIGNVHAFPPLLGQQQDHSGVRFNYPLRIVGSPGAEPVFSFGPPVQQASHSETLHSRSSRNPG